jgi:fucose permease
MSQERDLSHRQEREQEKEEHTHSTRGTYLSSRHLTWAVVVGVILIGAAVMVWTFLLPALRGPG